MRQRLGGLLALALGAVLITTGLSSTNSGAVGLVSLCEPAVAVGVSPMNNCPTGIITFTETTSVTTAEAAHSRATPHAPTPPSGGWKVLVTSTCIDPNTGLAVSQTVTVPNNGSAATGALYVYTSQTAATQCSYSYTQTNTPAGFTASFTPGSPATIPFGGGQTNSGLKVALANNAVVTPPSSSAPPSSTSPTSAVASSSAAPSTTTSSSVAPAATSSSPALANTGPKSSVRWSLILGIALCVLGVALLLAGGRPRSRRRHA